MIAVNVETALSRSRDVLGRGTGAPRQAPAVHLQALEVNGKRDGRRGELGEAAIDTGSNRADCKLSLADERGDAGTGQ